MSVSDGVHKPISPNPTQPPNPERSSVTRLEVWLGGSQRDAFGYVHSHRDHDNHIMSRLSNLFLLLPEIFFLFVMKDQILSLLHIHFTKVFFLCYRLYYMDFVPQMFEQRVQPRMNFMVNICVEAMHAFMRTYIKHVCFKYVLQRPWGLISIVQWNISQIWVGSNTNWAPAGAREH